MSGTHLELFPLGEQVVVKRHGVEDLPRVETQHHEQHLRKDFRMLRNNLRSSPVYHDRRMRLDMY
jgi:hypothetical protein